MFEGGKTKNRRNAQAVRGGGKILETLTTLLAGLGMLFMTLMLLLTYHYIVSDDEHEEVKVRISGIVFAVLGFISWFVAGAATVAIDVPYQFLYENAIDNSIRVVTGIQTTTAGAPLSTFFVGLGFICLAWVVIAVIVGLLGDVGARFRKRGKT